MQNKLGSIFLRKLITTFVATLITSIFITFFTLKDSDSEITYNLGNEFLGWSSVFIMYVGGIILIYGSIVSIGIEYLQRKWFKKHDWLYVLLHGIFGLANGLLFQYWILALHGMLAALLYACVDRWLYKRASKNKKSIKMFFLAPLLIYGVCWGYFYLISPPLPPFTKEDAIQSATEGEGTITDGFPKKEGKWAGIINGYQVEKETSVKETKKERYLVTLKEKWSKGNKKGDWTFSYQVDRSTLSLYKEEGEMPPYYK
ncbi:hypothetical protein [Pseudobacillus wudalianchiensis]|uniref:Uncharacterized protein n=1 Tax=Pseudobacillus wudalianchiensis TaxID=1743143 RepID=A0A1B9B952_9BACI|nr:hypothetical protein [Bacillus wudalianchiensis]OCA92602.1 hypothetical protein A8F95_02590 [Bacillus wudalianchiensis]